MSHADLLLLLQRKWTGQITPEELERLEACLRQSPQHAEWAEAYELIWAKATPPPQAPIMLNLDEEFDHLLARIEAQKASASASQPRSLWLVYRRRVMAVAAIGLLFLTAWFGWQQWIVTPREHQEHAVKDRHKVALPDGSVVSMRKGAHLTYTPERYGRQERKVYLEGEAFFEVEGNSKKPFLVYTPCGAEVEVVGTKFDVKASKTETCVVVAEGVVLLRSKPIGSNAQQSKSVRLSTHQKGRVNEAGFQKPITLQHLNELAWQTRVLVFKDTPLSEVCSTLEEIYGMRVELTNDAMKTCLYTGNYDSTYRAEDILRGICGTYGSQLTAVKLDHYRLVGGGCLK